MTSYVFVGPTLSPDEVASVAPDAVCLPPVAQGDVYRLALRRPGAIAIVDGYFSGAPSVWHKEILWALSRGVPVFGSASMGALRAAELHTFGMRGVGRIFEAFRDGALEDDDEVAVVHGPPEAGYVAVSEPMVNMRATLDRAVAEGVISGTARLEFERTAKALFFPHRTWPAVLDSVADRGVTESELARFRKWLPEGAVDQKRLDALEMLAAMQAVVAGDHVHAPDFRFEPTHFWDDLVERTSDDRRDGDAVALQDRILDELRLEGPEAYDGVMKNALLRMFIDWERRRQDPAIPSRSKLAAASRLRTALGLFSRSSLEEWMSQNDLDEPSLDRLVESEAQLRSLAESNRARLNLFLLEELRSSGRYGRLSARARDKAERLRSNSEVRPAARPVPAQLRVWFFEKRLGRAIPENVQSFAEALGYADISEFDRALYTEWMYTFDIRSIDDADGPK